MSRAIPVEADLVYKRAKLGLMGFEALILLEGVSIALDGVERED